MWLLGIFSKRISDIESLTEQKAFNSYTYFKNLYDEESDHSNKAVRTTPEIESGHKVSEEVK